MTRSVRLLLLGVSATLLTLFVTNYFIQPGPIEDEPPTTCNASSNLNKRHSTNSAIPRPRYSDQYVLGFTQDLPSLAFNVSAKAQEDDYGYGPAHLLNGLTDQMYWYQVGLAWNWVRSDDSGFVKDFSFIYQVWNSGGAVVYPFSGRAGIQPFSGPVNDGDLVLLSLNFSKGNVLMNAYDWNTSSRSTQTYVAKGTQFTGLQGPGFFFTGLMTEWYHVDSDLCSTEKVSYSTEMIALESGWMCINRWVFSVNSLGSGSSAGAGGKILFSNCSQPTPYQGQTLTYSSHGISIESGPSEFVTP